MKKLKLEVKCLVEVEVDERCDEAALAWACESAFEDWSDGRQPFSVELALDGIGRAAQSFLYNVHFTTACRLADKYPGARGRGYELERRMPEPRLRVGPLEARIVPAPVCLCGAVNPPVEVAEDGLERCVHRGCH